MARGNRGYGNPTPLTLANAIAYVHLAQSTKGIHMSTCSALMNLYEFVDTRPHYKFAPEALQLAERSPMMKAFAYMAKRGFKVREMGRHSPRSVELWNPTAEQYASIGRKGDIFVYPETGTWKDRTETFNVKDRP